MWTNPLETADLVTYTEEILNGKFHFSCSVTDISGLQEADLSSPETLENLRLKNLHEKIRNIFYNLWKLFLSKTLWSRK